MRGAWIEMCGGVRRACRAERRSPCGERGLKSENAVKNNFHYRVAPRAGSVD